MKNFIFIITFLFSSIIYGQNLEDLLTFKTISLNKIEEKLILRDWTFKGSKNEWKHDAPKNANLFDRYRAQISQNYETRSYEYIDYSGDYSTITITEYEDGKKNDVQMISENRLVYKKILENLIQANFNVTNDKSGYTGISILADNIGDKIYIESNGKVYKRGNHKVHLIINRFATVTGINNQGATYNRNSITDEYRIIVE